MDQAEFSQYQASIQRAENAYAAGQYASAYDKYAQLLGTRLMATLDGDAALENAGDILVAERLAQLALLFGEAEAADALLDGTATVAGRAGNGYLCDYLTLQRVHLALAAGRTSAAQRLLRSMSPSIGDLDEMLPTSAGLVIWEAQYGWAGMEAAPRALLRGNFYLACGQLFAAEGLYVPAAVCLARGGEHCAGSAPDLAKRLIQPLQLAKAAARLEQGELTAARQLLEAVGKGIDTLRQPASLVRHLELTGKLGLLDGEYGAALGALEEVVAIAGARGFHAAAVVATINLAHVLTLLNQTSVASTLLEQALIAARARDDQVSAVRIEVLIRLGVLRGQSLARETAIAPSVNEMWEGPLQPDLSTDTGNIEPDFLPQEGSFLAFCETRALSVHWHLGHGRLDRAREALAQLAQLSAHSDSPLIVLRLQILDGMLDSFAGACDQAVATLTSARERAVALGLRGELWQILRLLGGALARQGAAAAAAAVAAEADSLLQEQAASLGAAQRAMFLLNKWTADEEALAAAAHALQLLRREADVAGWPRRMLLQWRIRTGLWALMQRIDRHKALTAKHVLEPAPQRPAEFAAALRRRWPDLGWRSATLVFLVLPDRTVTIRASGLSLEFAVSAVTRMRLREIVSQWHERKDDGCVPLMQALGLDPLLAGLPARVSSLRIIPDDILHGVPFAALQYQGRYWVERYAMAVDFGSDLPHLPGRAGEQPLLLAGVSRASGPYPPLKGVPRELARVGAVLAVPHTPLLDANASRDVLLALLPRSELVHIACHGEFSPDQPDQSGLVLMPVPGKTEMLTVRDVAQLDLRAVRHVTLSSCWGASSFIAPGRWLISLPESLVRAGCGSVLASLWLVNDEAAEAFMAQFYRHLKTQRRDRALQLAQLACLAQADDAISSPWHWSGFVLYGAASPLAICATRSAIQP